MMALGPAAVAAGTPLAARAAQPATVPRYYDGDFEQYSHWFVDPIEERYFIDHGHAREMRWELMRDVPAVAVPSKRWFLQTHFPTPKVDPASYRLRVFGDAVAKPLSLSYERLVNMPSQTILRSIECGENGRVFYARQFRMQMDGTQWGLGAIGVAEFTGVRLSHVLELAGMTKDAVDVMPVGLDSPPDKAHRAARPMPVEKAMADDTLLIHSMNGKPLSANHGFPIRALVSGWIGPASVKWVGSIEVSAKPLLAYFNTVYGVMVGPDYPAQPPSPIGQVATFQNVKSALELGWEEKLRPGPQTITGRAWSGRSNIGAVEVRIDGGEWKRASVSAENPPIAWTRFSFDWDAPPGRHEIEVRATDGLGRVQPDREPWNLHGYEYGAVISHPVNVG